MCTYHLYLNWLYHLLSCPTLSHDDPNKREREREGERGRERGREDTFMTKNKLTSITDKSLGNKYCIIIQ